MWSVVLNTRDQVARDLKEVISATQSVVFLCLRYFLFFYMKILYSDKNESTYTALSLFEKVIN